MKILTNKQEQERESQIKGLIKEVALNENNYDLFTERIAALELALEDQDWLKLDSTGNKEISRAGRQKINDMARMFWLKNPLIRRATLTQALTSQPGSSEATSLEPTYGAISSVGTRRILRTLPSP